MSEQKRKKTHGGNQLLVLDQIGELSDYTDWSSTVTNNSQGEEKDIRAAYAQNGQAHKCEICSNRFPATVNCFDTYCIATLKRNRINPPSASLLALRRAN
jgi:hypothetical protein